MIIELVVQKLPPGTDETTLRQYARETIPRWKDNPELIRKHYVYTEDGCGAGIYVWPSREAAQRGHDLAWRNAVEHRTGSPPIIQYFDLFMILDNENGQITEFPFTAFGSGSKAVV